MQSWTIVCFVALVITPAVRAQDPPATKKLHKQVQAALDWQLPRNDCEQPKAPGFRQEIHDVQGTTIDSWDVDGYTQRRYERKVQRWTKCVDRYKGRLQKDFVKLKDSAQYGLTEAQANAILGKMKLIQTVLMSPDGTADGPSQ